MTDDIRSVLDRYNLADVPDGLSLGTIPETPCVERVRALPERPDIAPETVAALSRALCADPARSLRPHQALALRELHQIGGLVAPLQVGAGKTLITMLAPTVVQAERPVLVTRAKLLPEARREFCAYRADGWRVRLPHLVSYEKIGHPSGEHELLRLAPDLLMFDEAHKLRNLRSASSVRRIARAIQLLRPRVAVLSGSLFGSQLLRYWHMLCWALGEHAPVPLSHAEAKRWGMALDADTDGLKRYDLGALRTIPGDFHAHMRSRRGIVPTLGEDCPAEIRLSRWSPELPEALEATLAEVAATKTRPDGELLEDNEVADYLYQLKQGFWYRWDPMPPEAWLEPRRHWNAYKRAIVEAHVDGFDSPFAIENAMNNEALPQPPDHQIGRALYRAWVSVRDTYEPHKVAEWIDDAPLRAAIERAGEGTLIWTRHTAAGKRLATLGVPYCGGGDTDPRRYPGRTVACSIQAHATGKNLQAWHRNLVLTVPAESDPLEQLIGRTHRPGQKSDHVTVDMYTATGYDADVLSRVIRRSEDDSEAAGLAYKITKGVWY